MGEIMKLKGKVAIITGAAQGIGLGISMQYSIEGAKVFMLDIDESLGRSAATSVPGATFYKTDVSNKKYVEKTIEDIASKVDEINICVNNAGILKSGEVLDISEEDFDAVIGTNLKGAFFMSQAVGRVMRDRNSSGSIINMSSVNGVMTIPNILPYNVSKGGLDQLTRVMAIALAEKNIRVNSIGPGSILTEMLQKVMTDEEKRKIILSRTPMKRCGEVDEIARIAVFLASEDSSYITGQCIYADGGRLALNYTVPVDD